MKKQVLLPFLLLASAAASAQTSVVDYATVRTVVPQLERVAVQREVCETRQVYPAAAPSQQPNVGGAILGTVIGGVIGSRFGGGDGRLAATAVGAGVGAVVGSNMGNGAPAGVSAPVPARQCHTETTYEMQPRGYLVTYDYHGRQFSTILQHEPGANHLRVNVTVTPAQ